MKDKELKLNASGYYDEPCYKAITASPKPGEIWVHNQSGAYMLVMANVNGVCPTLRLNEVEKEGCIPVTCRDIMYTNPAFMGYVFETNLSQYVKTVKEDEMKAVKQKCAEVLDIHENKTVMTFDNGGEELRNERDALLRRVQALEDERIKLTNDHDMAVAISNDLHAESIELSKDLDKEKEKCKIYMQLYYDLIGKIISSKGECK